MNFIIGILRRPELFIAIIACLGLILQKKNISEIVKGTVKVIIGMLILFEGVNIVIKGVNPLSNAFSQLFAIKGSNTLASFSDFMSDYGFEIGLVMLLGLVINIIIARFTKFKSIYLTGNLLFWFSMLFIASGVEAGMSGLSLIIFATIFQVIVMVVSPALARPLVKNLTGSDEFTLGHTTTMFCLLGDFIGRFIGDPNKSSEDLKVPKCLDFFRDTTVTSGIVIMILYIVVLSIIGPGMRTDILAQSDIFTYSLVQGMTFAGGTVVLLSGVRMVLNEIVPAFRGISLKLVPGAIPALDVPIIFPYGQNALLIGFIVSMITSIITLFVIGSTGKLVFPVIPLTIACYFDVAPGAIFANKRGGVLAAVITSALGGIILIALVSITIPMLANTAGDFLQLYGGNEFSLFTATANFIAKLWVQF